MDSMLARRDRYVQQRNHCIIDELGRGIQGCVGATDRGTAVKALERQAPYLRERDVYRRLVEHDMLEVRGCTIPRLIDFDDELWCIEMTVVTPPYVLDFASAYLDRAPEYSQEMMAYWRAEKRELFGARWPEIQRIVGALAHVGILLFDLSPSNIRLPDHPMELPGESNG